jgi:hypothetical protein
MNQVIPFGPIAVLQLVVVVGSVPYWSVISQPSVVL